MDSTNLWPVRNRAAEQEVSGWASQHYRLCSASCQISGSAAALDSHRSTNPIMNCAWEGSRLPAPYENLMPDDLRWNSFILNPSPTQFVEKLSSMKLVPGSKKVGDHGISRPSLLSVYIQRMWWRFLFFFLNVIIHHTCHSLLPSNY